MDEILVKLSDGKVFVHALLQGTLLQDVLRGDLSRYAIVAILDFSSHVRDGKRMLTIGNLHIEGFYPGILGRPSELFCFDAHEFPIPCKSLSPDLLLASSHLISLPSSSLPMKESSRLSELSAIIIQKHFRTFLVRDLLLDLRAIHFVCSVDTVLSESPCVDTVPSGFSPIRLQDLPCDVLLFIFSKIGQFSYLERPAELENSEDFIRSLGEIDLIDLLPHDILTLSCEGLRYLFDSFSNPMRQILNMRSWSHSFSQVVTLCASIPFKGRLDFFLQSCKLRRHGSASTIQSAFRKSELHRISSTSLAQSASHPSAGIWSDRHRPGL